MCNTSAMKATAPDTPKVMSTSTTPLPTERDLWFTVKVPKLTKLEIITIALGCIACFLLIVFAVLFIAFNVLIWKGFSYALNADNDIHDRVILGVFVFIGLGTDMALLIAVLVEWEEELEKEQKLRCQPVGKEKK